MHLAACLQPKEISTGGLHAPHPSMVYSSVVVGTGEVTLAASASRGVLSILHGQDERGSGASILPGVGCQDTAKKSICGSS